MGDADFLLVIAYETGFLLGFPILLVIVRHYFGLGFLYFLENEKSFLVGKIWPHLVSSDQRTSNSNVQLVSFFKYFNSLWRRMAVLLLKGPVIGMDRKLCKKCKLNQWTKNKHWNHLSELDGPVSWRAAGIGLFEQANSLASMTGHILITWA